MWSQQPHWPGGRHSVKSDEVLQLLLHPGLAASATHSGSPTRSWAVLQLLLPRLALPSLPLEPLGHSIHFTDAGYACSCWRGEVSAFSRQTPKVRSRGASRSACSSREEDAVCLLPLHCSSLELPFSLTVAPPLWLTTDFCIYPCAALSRKLQFHRWGHKQGPRLVHRTKFSKMQRPHLPPVYIPHEIL